MNLPLWQTEWKLYVGFAASYFDSFKKSVQSQTLEAVAYNSENLVAWAKQHAQSIIDRANALVDYYGPPFPSVLEETKSQLRELSKANIFVRTEEVTL